MIARMDRLEIVCLRERLAEIVAFLQERGIVHIEEVPLAREDAPDYLKRVQLDSDQQREADSLDALYRSLSEAVPLLAVKPTPSQVAAAGSRMAVKSEQEVADMARSWLWDLRSFTRRRINVQDNIEILTEFQKTLQALTPLLGERDVALGKDARAFVLKGDGARVLESLAKRLREEAGPEARIVHGRFSRNSLVGVIVYPQDLNDTVGTVLKEEHIVPMDPPDKSLRGMGLREVLQKIDAAIAKNQSDAASLKRQIRQYSEQVGPDLMAVEAKIADRLAQLTAVYRFARSEMVGVIHGWAPSDKVEGFTALLDKRFPGQTLVSKLPLSQVDIHSIPTQLRNPSWLKPFEVLLTLFRPPTYGTMDPTALVAVSFVFFYGFILGDVAYGLAVIAFGYFLKRKFGRLAPVDAAGTVAYWMGGSAVVFGVLYGEFFGDFGEEYLHMPVLWIHRGHDVVTLMLYAIIFGCIHVPLALILGIRADLTHHHPKHAAEKTALLLGLTGIAIVVLGFAGLAPFGSIFFKGLAVFCFVAFFGILVWAAGLMAPIVALEVISLVGNVLSYCRLMALGLAGVLIADLANDLGGALGLLLGVPIALLVHALNIGLSMFSPTIHSLRLNYVEFLPKFYRPEGKSYQPFKKEALW